MERTSLSVSYELPATSDHMREVQENSQALIH